MPREYKNKIWEDINEGDELPSINFITNVTKNFIVHAAGTRDFYPAHNDRDFAVNSSGTKDIFLQTQHYQGLIDKLVQDWAGPEAWIAKRTIRMGTPVFPNENVIVTGKVVKKYEENGDHKVDIEALVSTKESGPCCPGSATLIMPTKDKSRVL